MTKKSEAPAEAGVVQSAPATDVTSFGAVSTEGETPPAPTVESAETSGVEVAVLARHGAYQVDTVVTLSADDAAIAVRDGWADDNPAAVEFVKSLAD